MVNLWKIEGAENTVRGVSEGSLIQRWKEEHIRKNLRIYRRSDSQRFLNHRFHVRALLQPLKIEDGPVLGRFEKFLA